MSARPHPVSPVTAAQIEWANATGRLPVVFIHGLWLLASSWERWAIVFEQAGYAPLTPGWPDDPDTVEEARAHPEVFAHKTVGQVAEHRAAVIERLRRRPAVIGHSFGGLLAQMIAGRGLSSASVAIDPASFRGVLPLRRSALKSSWPVLGKSREPAPRCGLDLQAVSVRVRECRECGRGKASVRHLRGAGVGRADLPGGDGKSEPMDAAEGGYQEWRSRAVADHLRWGDHVVPRAVAHASLKRQKRNVWDTEFVEIPTGATPDYR
jgi:non-heme chloroperoxidase